ncbi:MAG: substrate-binding domain-containing protein [Spirochaetota bacterium]
MFKKIWGVLVAVTVLAGFAVTPALGQQRDEPVEIYFFSGGPPGGTFSTVVYNGAKAAAEILGDRAKVKYVWSDWNPHKMVSQFQEIVAMNPDGIAVMGHPGVDALKPFVVEAERKGIVVTSQNVTLPELENRYKANGFGYVGQDLYDSGYMLGEAAVKRAGLGRGDRAFVWGLKREPTRGLRTRGAIDALEEAGLKVDYLEISPEVDKDASAGIPTIVGYLQKNPDCKLIITDHGQLTATIPTYLRAAGLGPNEVYGAGFDLAPPTLEGIESGYVDLVHSQQPFLQGFLPIFQIYLTIHYKAAGLHIDTGVGLVDKSNVDAIADLVKKGLAG